MNTRKLLTLTSICAIACTFVACLTRVASRKRSVVQALTSAGIDAQFTRSPGKTFVLREWYFRGVAEPVIQQECSEEINDTIGLFFSNNIQVIAKKQTLDSDSFCAFRELPNLSVDLQLDECDFKDTPDFPDRIQSCVFEESHDVDDVLRLLDGLQNTNIRFLALTMHWSEPATHLLAEKLRMLKKLEVLDITYGSVWYTREVDSVPLPGFPKLRLAYVSTELLEEMQKYSQ